MSGGDPGEAVTSRVVDVRRVERAKRAIPILVLRRKDLDIRRGQRVAVFVQHSAGDDGLRRELENLTRAGVSHLQLDGGALVMVKSRSA